MRIKTMMLLFCFGLSQFVYAQSQNGVKDRPQGDLAALRTDVRALQAEQQQIISRLDELKQILQGSGQPSPVSSLSIRGEMFRGDSAARVAIIEYADFECPWCGEYERSTFPQILSEYIATGKVKYFYRDLPLPGHARAVPAAIAARCAGEQGKFWEYHDLLFESLGTLPREDLFKAAEELHLDTKQFDSCLSSGKYKSQIDRDFQDGIRAGVFGTPGFFINGVFLAGAQPASAFEKIIEEELHSGKRESAQK